MPRIALVPLFLLWFRLGIGSKIAVSFSLTFFIVLSATTAGMRSVDRDHLLLLSQSLGATSKSDVLQGNASVCDTGHFLGCTARLDLCLAGVVGAELIAAEHGLGQTVAYLQATFNADGVMAILFLLALLGLGASSLMSTLERNLLAWQ